MSDKLKYLKDILLNDQIYFISFGMMPDHANRYSLGEKLYKNDKIHRFEPSLLEAKSLKRIVGSVIVSMHPLTDLDLIVTNIPNNNYNGELVVSEIIIPERECSFVGYVPGGRVMLNQIIEYPSFVHYDNSYMWKYGIDKQLFNQYKRVLEKEETKDGALDILTQHLASFNAILQFQKAHAEARKLEKIIVYQNLHGGFSLSPPPTVQTQKNNSMYKPAVRENRESRSLNHNVHNLSVDMKSWDLMQDDD